MQHIAANQGPKSKMYVPYSIRCISFIDGEHSPLLYNSMMMVMAIEYICRQRGGAFIWRGIYALPVPPTQDGCDMSIRFQSYLRRDAQQASIYGKNALYPPP